MKKDKDRFTLDIKIKNVTVAQAIAIESYLSVWETLGGLGSSRWTSFFADGDGNFRPQIEVNGKKAQHTDLLNKEDLWKGHRYDIDFDSIGWKLFDSEEDRKKEEKFLKTPNFVNRIRSLLKRGKE